MNESALIQHAKNGDLEAFNSLVMVYQDLVYNHAYRMLGDSYEAEDAAQTAFIRAYQKLASHRGGSFRAWLMRIVTNICYDELRRQRSRPRTALEPLDEFAEWRVLPYWMTDESTMPEAYVEREEFGETIQRCLQLIPTEYRVALILVDIQGLSYAETAEALDVPVGTVKSRLARGRMLLRSHLLASEDNLFEDPGMVTHDAESLVLALSD